MAAARGRVEISERRHNRVMCWLYSLTFGFFIACCIGFPLLARMLFPEADTKLVFIVPFVSVLSRGGAGWLARKYGGAWVILWGFVMMVAGIAGALWFAEIKAQPGALWGFFVSFVLLFLAVSVSNASLAVLWRYHGVR